MAEVRDDRISQALEGLVRLLLPQDDSEDDAVYDDRYWSAIESAQDDFDNAQEPSVSEDEDHVAGLIRQKRETHVPVGKPHIRLT